MFSEFFYTNIKGTLRFHTLHFYSAYYLFLILNHVTFADYVVYAFAHSLLSSLSLD
jgi:hypothetical protein